MDWDQEKQLINDAADALTERRFEEYEAIKAANPDYDWASFDYRKGIAAGKTVEELGPDPIWRKLGYHGATTKRALDRDNEK